MPADLREARSRLLDQALKSVRVYMSKTLTLYELEHFKTRFYLKNAFKTFNKQLENTQHHSNQMNEIARVKFLIVYDNVLRGMALRQRISDSCCVRSIT